VSAALTVKDAEHKMRHKAVAASFMRSAPRKQLV
jgi:hypothetical protein